MFFSHNRAYYKILPFGGIFYLLRIACGVFAKLQHIVVDIKHSVLSYCVGNPVLEVLGLYLNKFIVKIKKRQTKKYHKACHKRIKLADKRKKLFL